jgi:hypothetical protein
LPPFNSQIWLDFLEKNTKFASLHNYPMLISFVSGILVIYQIDASTPFFAQGVRESFTHVNVYLDAATSVGAHAPLAVHEARQIDGVLDRHVLESPPPLDLQHAPSGH